MIGGHEKGKGGDCSLVVKPITGSRLCTAVQLCRRNIIATSTTVRVLGARGLFGRLSFRAIGIVPLLGFARSVRMWVVGLW